MAVTIIEKLGLFFAAELKDVKCAWVAAALFNDDGFAELQAVLEKRVIQHFLIGIDLPTPVSLLRVMHGLLKPGTFEARICKLEKISFHPKVYLFEFYDNSFKVVIGSANLTTGGLVNNKELNVLIDDPIACADIKNWFDALYKNAFPLDDENIKRYEERWTAYQPAADALHRMRHLVLQKPLPPVIPFEEIDFSDRYFKREHHLAFHRDLWYDYSPEANAKRKVVSEVFTDLHGLIFPQFRDYGLAALHPNVPAHLVSMYYHDPNRTGQALNAMWLSYGKSQPEIKKYHQEYGQPYIKGENQEDDKQSFINHARLQIRIEYQEIGIWILFAKNNGGGVIDRNVFGERMQKDEAYRETFFVLLKKLPAPYWISVGGDRKDVADFTDKNMLYQFCKKDNKNQYFFLGRDYAIADPEMSTERLPEEVLKIFKLLYPLYRHMRHYFN